MSGDILVACERTDKAPPYVDALVAGGADRSAIRVVAPPLPGTVDLEALAATAGGLLLCGGPDLAPHHYGEPAHPEGRLSIWPEVDAVDLALFRAARQRRVPVWGVCRGLQTINVALGGTLWQDLHLQWPGAIYHSLDYPRDLLVHPLRVVAPETELGADLGEEGVLVNSRHHQAVKTLAPGLVPVAFAPDGVLEAAVLDRDDWWVRGVQWHPENLVELAVHRRLWTRFVAAVGTRRGRP